MKIMLDTNVLVSMIFFSSDDTRRFRTAICDRNELVLCDYVLEELRIVTERNFFERKVDLEYFLFELPYELVYTPRNMDFNEFPSVRDQKDTPILATAMIEGVDVFVTGDKDFLVLEVEVPEIVTMTEFMKKYHR